MANRYWVGGTASWDGTAGTKWATTSGGAGGAAVPTSADDVFFDANSGANTVTIASGNTGAKSITCTGFTGTLAGSSAITVSGSVTLVVGMTFSNTSTWTLAGTGTLVSAGKTFSALTISGSGITVTLGDALAVTNALTVTRGTFDTANYNVTAGNFSSDNSNTRTVALGSSTITITTGSVGWNIGSSTGLTFNAGTSQINFTGTNSGSAMISANNATFYNVAYNGASGSPFISGAGNTFNNLTISSPSATGITSFGFGGTATINGILACSGASGIRRVFVRSDTFGTSCTLTVATCAPADCDFRDITIAGAAAPISGTRLGDCGGNSGITFPAAKTVYWNPAASAQFASASWATSSGSTTLSTDNFPLAQDTAVFDNASRAGVSDSSSGISWNVGSIDFSSRTTALTFNISRGLSVYGDWTQGSGYTSTFSTGMYFSGRSTQTITCNGVNFKYQLYIQGVGNTVQLADAFIGTTSPINLNSGTFDAANYNVTTTQFVTGASGTSARTLKMGSGTWTLSSTGAVWNIFSTTNLTFNKETANIVLSDTSSTARTFAGGGLTYNKLTIGGTTGTSTLTFTGSNTFSELASTKTVAHTLSFTAGTTTTVGAWTISGTSGNVVTIQSATAASHTLTKTGGGTVSSDYLSISRSTATPGSTWYAGTTSTDGGNNSGWIFSALGSSTGSFFALFR